MALNVEAIRKYGLQAAQGNKKAIEALQSAGVKGMLTDEELRALDGRSGVWIYKIDANRALRENPYVAYIPKVHFTGDKHDLTQGEFHLLEDEQARNVLEMQFYGLSWAAFLDCPIEKPVLNTLRVDPLFAVPVKKEARKNTDSVQYFQGIGVSYPGKDFPIRIGTTYWLVPQREDFQDYEADFCLEAWPTDELEMFNGFPLKPLPLPFVVSSINITGSGMTLELSGDNSWISEHREWNRMEARIPLQYPNIYQTEGEAQDFANTIKGWD